MDDRILLPIAIGEGGAPGHTQKGVDAVQIEELLETLSAAACSVDVVPAGMRPVAKAAEKTKTPCTEIIHLILGGYLTRVVTLSSEWGYAAIHVDPDEVRAKRALPGLSTSMVASRLHWPVDTVWALLRERDGGAHLHSTLVTSPNGRHKFRRIAPETIEAFQASYGNSVEISVARNLGRIILERRLQSAHIRPAISEKEVGVDFFLLKDLDARLGRSKSTKVAA